MQSTSVRQWRMRWGGVLTEAVPLDSVVDLAPFDLLEDCIESGGSEVQVIRRASFMVVTSGHSILLHAPSWREFEVGLREGWGMTPRRCGTRAWCSCRRSAR